MRRPTTTLAAMLLALSMLAGPAGAEEHDMPPDFATPHRHVLLVGADVLDQVDPVTGAPYIVLDYDRCVDLAGGQAPSHNRFHTNIHVGRAGQALRGAGHIVVPFFDCATLDELYGK